MIEISLYIKKKIVDLKSSFTINREKQQTISVNRPETFKELEQIIKTKFNLSGKDFIIKGVDSEEEDHNVRDEETYKDEEIKNCLKFNVFIEEEMNSENNHSKKFDDFDIDKILDITNELTIEEDEFKKLLDSQVDEVINKEKFEIKEDKNEKNYKSMNNNLFNHFWDGLQKEIDTETEKQKKTFLDSIKEEFFPFDKIFDDKVNSMNKNLEKIILQANEAKAEAKKINNYIPLIPLIKPEEKKESELSEEKVNEIYKDLDERLYISATAGENKMKEIIRKFGGNMEKINFYAENFSNDLDDEDIMKEYVPKKSEVVQNELPNKIEEELGDDKVSEIYKKLEEKYNINKIIDEDKMKKTIKELRGDMEKIKEYVESKIDDDKKDKNIIKEDEPEKKDNEEIDLPIEENGELSEEKVNEIYQKFEDAFYVSSTIGVERMKEAIRELKGDLDKIQEFVEKN